MTEPDKYKCIYATAVEGMRAEGPYRGVCTGGWEGPWNTSHQQAEDDVDAHNRTGEGHKDRTGPGRRVRLTDGRVITSTAAVICTLSGDYSVDPEPGPDGVHGVRLIHPRSWVAPGGVGPWRTGRKVGRTIYDGLDALIGTMDTPALAERVVEAVNRQDEPVHPSLSMIREAVACGDTLSLYGHRYGPLGAREKGVDLLGDVNYCREQWGNTTREEAIRQANHFHAEMTKALEDAERLRAEIARYREALGEVRGDMSRIRDIASQHCVGDPSAKPSG